MGRDNVKGDLAMTSITSLELSTSYPSLSLISQISAGGFFGPVESESDTTLWRMDASVSPGEYSICKSDPWIVTINVPPGNP